MSIKCFVTGHRGYIGSHLYKELEERGYEVRGIDLKEGEDIIHDLEKYDDFKPDYIFHLAAFPRVVYSMEFPEKVLENNILSTIRILEFARKHNCKRVIYSSSSSVLGNREESAYEPTSPYGASKLVPEILCKNYSRVFGVDTVSLRYFNVYSKDQTAVLAYATAIASFMEHIRQGKTPYVTGDGNQTRDMLHVKDAVAANIFCALFNSDFGGEIFDVGTGENIKLNEVKDLVLNYFPNLEFEYVEERPGDVRSTRAETLKLKNLGWQTRISIREGIEDCFKSLKKELDE